MLYGIMISEDVKLTKIWRELHEDIPLKSTEKRFRRQVNLFEKQGLITEKLFDSGVYFIIRAREIELFAQGKSKKSSIYQQILRVNIVSIISQKKDEKCQYKISITKIEFNGKPLNFVVCNRLDKKKLLMQVTNVFDDDKAICKTIVKCYIFECKINNFIDSKKETFNFGDIRVMSLKLMNTLNLLLNILINFSQ